MNIIFDYPAVLLLIFFQIIAFSLLHFKKNRGGRLPLSISVWQGDNFKVNNNGYPILVHLSSLLFWSALTVILIAAAGPAKVEKEKIYLNRGRDIMLVLDESPSMFSRDLGESRFTVAKEQILNFISLRENDAIGLITYSSEAVLRVPLTTDYQALIRQIELMEHRDIHLGDGTDIGMALAFACYHLSTTGGADKIIVLITDGVDNGGLVLPLEAAKEASKLGIRVYPIGLGNFKQKSSLLIEDSHGNVMQGEIESVRNDTLLQQIAKTTGGEFDSSSSISVLEEILHNISSEIPSNPEGRIERVKVSLVAPFIWAALAMLTIVVILRKLILKELL